MTNMTTKILLGSVAISAMMTQTALAQQQIEDEVVAIGTRATSKPRTDIDKAVPVDVVKADDLFATGQTDLGQQVQFTSPSFNSAKYGVNGTTNYADPASLRGLGPDQVLVTVNGKRRHQFSAINLNVAPGLGTVVTDLNSIPGAALKRVEVLRDGAAAQYGSDAIAGVINLALEDRSDGGRFTSTVGIFNEGDGFTFKNTLNHGFKLGEDGGFFNYTLEFFDFEGTNRSDEFTGTIYPTAPATSFDANGNYIGPTPEFPYDTATPRADRNVYPQGPFVVGNYGSNENTTYQAFVNSALPISDTTELYSFGGYSRKEILAYGFFRNPGRRSRAVLSVFPDGYVPELPGVSQDQSITGGLKTQIAGFDSDFSISYGENQLDLDANNTTNPSLGSQTPTEFTVGAFKFGQTTAEANFSKNFGSTAWAEDFNFAFGGQYRKDRFQLLPGSPESFEVGPLATDGRDIGSSARPGISTASANDISRDSIGIYIDTESDISDQLLITAAARYENYSDFGGNLSGKLAARYKLSDQVALRASYNRGFRAPSLQQLGNRQNTSTVQNGEIVITSQASSDDVRLEQLGVAQPEAEISNNYNIGLTTGTQIAGGNVNFTVDAYQIDIDDRIVITERINTSQFPAVATLYPNARELRFFTNAISTQTRGLDIVGTYGRTFDNDSSLDITLAASFNKTNVKDQIDPPAALVAGSTNSGYQLLGQTATELIEVAVPREKILLGATYMKGPFAFNARMSHFGNVKAFSRGLSDQDSNVECEGTRCVQTFSAKQIFDASVSYNVSETATVTVGSNNIFDTYPDKYNNRADGDIGQASSYANGQIPYSRNSNQFGFNGAYYYATIALDF